MVEAHEAPKPKVVSPIKLFDFLFSSTPTTSLSENQDDGIRKEIADHENRMKEVNEERTLILQSAEKMKGEIEEEHKEKTFKLSEKWKTKTEKVVSNLNYVTNSIRDDELKVNEEIERLKCQLFESEQNNATMEIENSQRNFERLEAEKNFNEFLSQRHNERITVHTAAVHEEERRVAAIVRDVKSKNAELVLQQMKNDLEQQRELGMANLGIQNSAMERSNRRHVNKGIWAVKGLMQELDNWYSKAFEVIGASPKIYAMLNKKKRRSCKESLMRFSEVLNAIVTKMNEMEQTLGMLELVDVNMKEEILNLKTRVSSFGTVIANLKLILELDGEAIDPETSTEFSTLKTDLFDMINKMAFIDEKRDAIKQLIQERHDVIGRSSEK